MNFIKILGIYLLINGVGFLLLLLAPEEETWVLALSAAVTNSSVGIFFLTRE
jgi:hypothetical protein